MFLSNKIKTFLYSSEKMAFTLAEVLITLLVIGVVASLVIPALLQNTQDQEFKTAWKKAYSEIAQATQYLLMDNGNNLVGLCSDDDHNCLRNKYLLYLTSIKQCNTGASLGNCWSATQKYLDGTKYVPNDFAGAILMNGTAVRFYMNNQNCDFTIETGTGLPICAKIIVDVNGLKKPNTYGKDMFSILILKNRILPEGVEGDTYIRADCSTYGMGCSAKYLSQ